MTVHFTEKYLLNPQHRITVHLVGMGGTGSHMIECLCRLNEMLQALDHPGLHVRAWDDKEFSEANTGRTKACPPDMGINKAVALITRANRSYGLDWEASPDRYKADDAANIVISCVDTIAARIAINAGLEPRRKAEAHRRGYYWLDMGNLHKTGQVVLGTVGEIAQPDSSDETRRTLPNVFKKFPQLNKMKDKDQGPSCSAAEALRKQDLFINSTLAQFGAGLIWKLFREGVIRFHGCYVNLDTYVVNPIPIK